MAVDFIIKKGRSTVLFDENGACRIPQEKLIVNGWYLTTDTAEVYVALKQDSGLIELKKINECDVNNDLDLESFEERLTALEEEEVVETYGYRVGFPTQGETGHIYVAIDEQKTYVWFDNAYVVVGAAEAESPDLIFGGTAKE